MHHVSEGRRIRCAVAVCALLLSRGSVADDLFPPELTQFPVVYPEVLLTGRGAGHWDAAIRERGWILRDGDRWHLWYTGYDGTRAGQKKLGYATSRSGLKWTRLPQPVYTEHWVEDMMVVRRPDAFYMFAEGRDDQAQLLKSDDGLKWSRVGRLDVRLVSGEPIPEGPYGTPTAWFEDGLWHLFYERRDAGVWLATSRDLKVWTNRQDTPVLRPEPELDLIAMNQIVRFNDRYYAMYHGAQATAKPRLWSTRIAVSSDLVNWTKYPGNPLRPARENKSSGLLIHDGDQFRLYTMHNKVEVHFPGQSN